MRYTLPLMLAASALAAPLALPTESSKIPIPIIDFSSSGSATLPGASTESPRPPLLPVTTSSTSGSASAALPNPSGAAKFRPDRPGQRFACDNPKKWPNGIIPLIAHNAKEMDQNSCLGLVNPPPDSPPPTSSPTEGHLPSPSPKLSARFATNSTIPLPVTNVTGNATVTGTATFYQYNNFTGVVSHSLVVRFSSIESY
ncbi:hypothetical protein C8R47DRAFT_687385 [Mycena vitilis]|nr:hypothetical protein C8R47DRAFT_687385 [Mycena vitilis]